MTEPSEPLEVTPEQFRRHASGVLELLIELLAEETQDPILRRPAAGALAQRLGGSLPERGTSLEQLLGVLRRELLPYRRKNGHPRFFGYVCGAGDPLGVLADALVSTLNQNVTAWRSAPAAAEIERQAIAWLAELVGFGSSHGLLTSGGSMANFHAVACALANASPERGRVSVYLSEQAHLSLRKAARILGVGEDRVRVLGVTPQRRLRLDELERALAADRRAGLVPGVVCASAGTANTGTIDPLQEIAELCARERVWLHIDGAYGAPAAATEAYAWLRGPFSLADSLSLDPHKWLFAPLDAGCLLVRDEAATRRAFALDSEYIHVAETEPRESHAFFDHGIELSRRARGLKLWLLLELRGRRALVGAIDANIALRERLDARIAAEPRLEPLGSELSIACFRYRPAGDADEPRLQELNAAILDGLVRQGRFFMSPTTLEGRYALRVCIVNFRTRREDVDALLDAVLHEGAALA